VPQLGLGLAAVGRPAYITAGRDRDLPPGRSRSALGVRSHELLDRAYAAGVRYVDVARSYGDAERFLGRWLRERAVEDVFVASKWGYRYVGDWRMDSERHEVKSHDLATFERQLAESRAELGDRLRLYQVHSVTPDSPLLDDGALLRRLAGLRADGIEVGASTSGARQAEAIRRLLEVTVDGARLMSSVQATWNLLEPSAGPALAEAHSAGLRVVVKEAVANGRLTPHDRDLDPRLVAVADRHGVGVDAVALAAAGHQPWCDVVLSGAVTVDQLDANMAAHRIALGDRDAAELAGLAEPATAYWDARARLPWA
jgi:aryl-alcohol dehydrogenase-like predicted oxidoreductase